MRLAIHTKFILNMKSVGLRSTTLGTGNKVLYRLCFVFDLLTFHINTFFSPLVLYCCHHGNHFYMQMQIYIHIHMEVHAVFLASGVRKHN